MAAHIKPTIKFGVNLNSRSVDMVADGFLQFHAIASISNGGSGLSFCCTRYAHTHYSCLFHSRMVLF